MMDLLILLAALTQKRDCNDKQKDNKYQLIKDIISESKDYNKKMSTAIGYIDRIFENIRNCDIIKDAKTKSQTYNEIKSLIFDGINFVEEINDYRYINSETKRKCQSRLLNKFLKYNQLLHSMSKIIQDENISESKKIDCIIKLSK